MAEDPLWHEPVRPEIADGIVVNSFAIGEVEELRDDVPLAADRLRPNQAYRSAGLEYFTDAFGLPARVRGGLRLVDADDRVRHHREQLAAGRLAGESGFDGGHLVAVSLGGFASGPNLTPQVANVNRSAYKRLENGWRDALRDGVTVEVDVALSFDDDQRDVAPEIVVTWWEDGDRWDVVLLNEEGVQ